MSEEKKLFANWLAETAQLQQDSYGVNYTTFHGDTPGSLLAVIDYARWNMLAIDDELAEMRQAMSWKPWQHDAPYLDRDEVVREAVDVLHFVANIICAMGTTDAELDAMYVEKMEKNRARQANGYRVKDAGVKCRVCSRALDDIAPSAADSTVCEKCGAA